MTTNHFYIGCGYFKNIHIGETQIIASQNDYGNLVSFLEKRNTKSVTSIGFCRITKFIPNEEMVGIEISYGRETVFFQFENENDYFHFFEELQIKCNLLNPIYTKYGKGSFDAVIESIRDSLRLFFTFLILFCFLLLMLLPKRSSRRDESLEALFSSLESHLTYVHWTLIIVGMCIFIILRAYLAYRNSRQTRAVFC